MNPLFTALSIVLLFSFASCSSQTETVASAPYTDLTNEEFKEKMSDTDVVILDVRTPGEIAGGKIGDALEINFNSKDFNQKIAQLNKDKTYLVYCAGGVRSSKACKKMSDMGFSKLYNLSNGYGSWK